MGCTTALQALVAGVPVLELTEPDSHLNLAQARDLSHLFFHHPIKTSQELITAISDTCYSSIP